jgi:hypothetical protein
MRLRNSGSGGDAVPRLTGRSARTFAQFLDDNARLFA